MKPSLSWIDLTAHDRTRMRRVLDLFSERGTVDELGLGTLRDAFSDALFPGTSSIQTRLRYVLFVPWIYQALAAKGVRSSEVTERARAAELALIHPLSQNPDHEGVIGSRARGTLKRLPSGVYWSALVRWGIFQHAQSQSWFHARFERLGKGGHDLVRADDPGVVWTRKHVWSPHMPPAPADFPRSVSFALRRSEATFLRDQIAARCPDSLLAWLATEGAAPTGAFWDDPAVAGASEELRHTVELARRFSLHVEAAPLLYNLLLAQERHRLQGHQDDADRIDAYRAHLASWADAEAAERPFHTDELWAFVATRGATLPEPQRRFVEAWTERLRERGPHAVSDDPLLAELIREREITLKTNRSRFTNQGRLLDWSGSVGVGRLDFRWSRVRQLLTDLHHGLEA